MNFSKDVACLNRPFWDRCLGSNLQQLSERPFPEGLTSVRPYAAASPDDAKYGLAVFSGAFARSNPCAFEGQQIGDASNQTLAPSTDIIHVGIDRR